MFFHWLDLSELMAMVCSAISKSNSFLAARHHKKGLDWNGCGHNEFEGFKKNDELYLFPARSGKFHGDDFHLLDNMPPIYICTGCRKKPYAFLNGKGNCVRYESGMESG